MKVRKITKLARKRSDFYRNQIKHPLLCFRSDGSCFISSFEREFQISKKEIEESRLFFNSNRDDYGLKTNREIGQDIIRALGLANSILEPDRDR